MQQKIYNLPYIRRIKFHQANQILLYKKEQKLQILITLNIFPSINI